MSEIDKLRKIQSEKVMPLIGQLLDRWDELPNDVKQDDELSKVKGVIAKIDAAMEGD